jgi:AmmeMemoRadiSam system protein A
MGGRLRGCIGHFLPDKPLYEVVQEMTIAAANLDQRFAPVESTELPYISIEISVLTPLEKITTLDEFELERHGIYMTKDGRSGTFLPQVAIGKGWSKEDFLGHCSRDKAGLGWEGWKEADLYVYEAIVFGEQKKE